jgi:hypothetical protein
MDHRRNFDYRGRTSLGNNKRIKTTKENLNMKTKFIWVALLASAAMIAQAKAGGHYGGGGGFGGAFASAHPATAHGGAVAPTRPMTVRNFGGGRAIYSGRSLSSTGLRSQSLAAFRQRSVNSSATIALARNQFTPLPSSRSDQLTRSQNNFRFAQNRTAFAGANGTIENRRVRVSQIRHGNGLPANWRNHVIAQSSASWHREWDRGRDHWWHGHHCRFINGSWVIFDLGFYPWWPYWYPYDYYPYDYSAYSASYYPYSYDPGSYDPGLYQDQEYYDQDNYKSSAQSTDAIVADAQKRLSQLGYYRGEIDGIFGAETRRAIVRYQRNHGLRATGYLTTDTLQTLGLQRLAND